MFSHNPICLLPRERLFPFADISSNHNHVSRYKFTVFNLNELNRQDKISFGAMHNQNIEFLTVLLEK